MIIQLTTHCSEGCKHCFADCTPDDNHMSWDVLYKTIEYIKGLPIAEMEVFTGSKMGLRPVNLIVSGGEPTEHPEYEDMIVEIATELPYCNIILETNGQWYYTDKGKQRMRKVLELSQLGMVLCTSDHRYYPNYNKFMLNKDGMVEFGIEVAKSLLPDDKKDDPVKSKVVIGDDTSSFMETVRLGRASGFPEVKDPRPATPNCVQLTYMAQEQRDISSVLVSLEHRGLYTSPIFGVDGTIYPGISHLCERIGDIYTTSYEALYTYLKDRFEPCGKCQLNHRMPESVTKFISQNRKLAGLVS